MTSGAGGGRGIEFEGITPFSSGNAVQEGIGLLLLMVFLTPCFCSAGLGAVESRERLAALAAAEGRNSRAQRPRESPSETRCL